MAPEDCDRLSDDDARILGLESATITGHTLKLIVLEPGPDPLEEGQGFASFQRLGLPEGGIGQGEGLLRVTLEETAFGHEPVHLDQR